MKNVLSGIASLLLCAVSFMGSSCTSNPSDSQNKPPANASTTPAPATKLKTTATGTLIAKPNPIKVCDKTGAGIATLSWTSNGASAVEIRVGKPDGDLFAKSGPEPGTWTTGKWVGDGMTFYLQDVSGGKSLTPENTIGTAVVKITSVGCP